VLFKLQDMRYTFDPDELKRARVAAGLTLKEFAFECGWTLQYQWRLENGFAETVCEATKKMVEKTFNQLV